MGLQDVFRKAASLIVETPDAPPSASGDANAEIDALLAASDAKSLDLESRRGATEAQPSTEELLARGGIASSAPKNTKTVAQIVQDANGPNLEEIANRPAAPATANAQPDAPLKPGAIYNAANLPPTPFAAEQMLEMLASLPKELPLETRRATVKVTLNALGKSVGATPETIVADASRKMAALAAYSQHLTKRTGEFATREEAAIAELEKQIEAKKTAINRARQAQAQTLKNCDEEAERLDDVLEFFSLDVAPSKYAPATPNANTLNVAASAPKTN